MKTGIIQGAGYSGQTQKRPKVALVILGVRRISLSFTITKKSQLAAAGERATFSVRLLSCIIVAVY